MRPGMWSPPVVPSVAEQVVIKAVRRAKLFVFLRQHRHELFTPEFQAELAEAYVDSSKGQPPVAPAQLALAVILQACTGAYLASTLVRDRSDDLVIYCKAWRIRNTGGRFAKTGFRLDFDRGELTCSNQVTMPFQPGKTVRFPTQVCASCPLRCQCTTSTTGRSIHIHPDEHLLAELRRRQHTPEGRAALRQRTAVEHGLAHIGHWQGRRSRYRGTRKNLFDLRRCAVVHNLHVIAHHNLLDQQAA